MTLLSPYSTSPYPKSVTSRRIDILKISYYIKFKGINEATGETMGFDKFTVKSQEAIAETQAIAQKRNQHIKGRRGKAGDSGAVREDEEQPRADRGAGSRKDGHSRGACTKDSLGRRPGSTIKIHTEMIYLMSNILKLKRSGFTPLDRKYSFFFKMHL